LKNPNNSLPGETFSAPPEALHLLARILGHRFRDLNLLDQALRHSSFAHEFPETGPSNERLEFLGDAVLDLVVSDLLLERYPEATEGELSRLRSALVNARQLAALGRTLKLGEHLLLGRGETQQAGAEKPSLLADALEAVLGAIFLDGGFSAAKRLIRRWFTPLAEETAAALAWHDCKTRLQEQTQSHFRLTPTYQVVQESGPPHARHFRVEVRLGDRTLAQGDGPTKKQAAQQAAGAALQALEKETGGGG
jgi:ribonuclease-3